MKKKDPNLEEPIEEDFQEHVEEEVLGEVKDTSKETQKLSSLSIAVHALLQIDSKHSSKITTHRWKSHQILKFINQLSQQFKVYTFKANFLEYSCARLTVKGFGSEVEITIFLEDSWENLDNGGESNK